MNNLLSGRLSILYSQQEEQTMGRKIGNKTRPTNPIPGFLEAPHAHLKESKSAPTSPMKIKSSPKSPSKSALKVGSPKNSPSPIMEAAEVPSTPESGSSSPRITPIKYSYKQTKSFCEILQTKLNIKFWICLSDEQRAEEKENPTDAAFYRLGYCVYNGLKLVNIVRYYPDRTKYVKAKSYATINLALMKTTNNSQNKIDFTDEEATNIKRILG